DAGIELRAKANVDGLTVAAVTLEVGSTRSLADRVAQLRGRNIGAGRGGAVLGAVEADDGVEVHETAGLELRDLGVRDPDKLAPRAFAEPRASREDSDQFDDE